MSSKICLAPGLLCGLDTGPGTWWAHWNHLLKPPDSHEHLLCAGSLGEARSLTASLFPRTSWPSDNDEENKSDSNGSHPGRALDP